MALLDDHAREQLESLLLEGLYSGDSIEATPDYWAMKKQQLIERYAQRPTGAEENGHGAPS
jgi:hypothetical protein